MTFDTTNAPASPDVPTTFTVAPARKARPRPVSSPWPLAQETDARTGLLHVIGRLPRTFAARGHAMDAVFAAASAETNAERVVAYEAAMIALVELAHRLLDDDGPRRFAGTVATILNAAADVGERLELWHGGAK